MKHLVNVFHIHHPAPSSRHSLMTASLLQANRFIGGIGVQKKIVSNGCMSHVFPLHFPAFSCIFLQIPMFQNCHEVLIATIVGVKTMEKNGVCLCFKSMLHASTWETLTAKSLCNNIHEYFHHPWVSSFSITAFSNPQTPSVPFHLTCIRPNSADLVRYTIDKRLYR